MLPIRRGINHCFISKHHQVFYLSTQASQFRYAASDKDSSKGHRPSLLNRLKVMIKKAWEPEESELDTIFGKGKEMRQAELEMLEAMRKHDMGAKSRVILASRSNQESSESDTKQY